MINSNKDKCKYQCKHEDTNNVILKNTDNYEEHIEYVSDRIYNDIRYFIDSSKLEKMGWKPYKQFDEELIKL